MVTFEYGLNIMELDEYTRTNKGKKPRKTSYIICVNAINIHENRDNGNATSYFKMFSCFS